MTTPHESIVSEVVAASLSGAISASILYPLHVLKTKNIQASIAEQKEDDDAGMMATAQQLYKKEGMAVFFRGLPYSALQSSLEKTLFFFSYTLLKQFHGTVTGGGATMSPLTSLFCGYVAEWSHLPITVPMDAVATALQTSSQSGAFQLLLTMLADRTVYQSLPAYYLLCLKPAIQYTVYERIKSVWLTSKSRTALTAVEAFVMGMVARTIATVLLFPFLKAKVLLQTQTMNQKHSNEPTTIIGILKQQWQQASLYRGLGPELTRGVLSAALMIMMKERIAEKVQTAIISSRLKTCSYSDV